MLGYFRSVCNINMLNSTIISRLVEFVMDFNVPTMYGGWVGTETIMNIGCRTLHYTTTMWSNVTKQLIVFRKLLHRYATWWNSYHGSNECLYSMSRKHEYCVKEVNIYLIKAVSHHGRLRSTPTKYFERKIRDIDEIALSMCTKVNLAWRQELRLLSTIDKRMKPKIHYPYAVDYVIPNWQQC